MTKSFLGIEKNWCHRQSLSCRRQLTIESKNQHKFVESMPPMPTPMTKSALAADATDDDADDAVRCRCHFHRQNNDDRNREKKLFLIVVVELFSSLFSTIFRFDKNHSVLFMSYKVIDFDTFTISTH